MEISLFQTLSALFFALAVLHVFVSDKFQKKARSAKGGLHAFYALFGNTTLIFGIWLVPTLIAMLFLEGSDAVYAVLEGIDYQEPFAYFVLITIATIRPMIQLFHYVLEKIGHVLGNRLALWWAFSLLLLALIGGCFSPIAVMALLCLGLSSTFFGLKPSAHLTYFTFALLLIAASASAAIFPLNFTVFFQRVGPVLGHFELFRLFGWRALIALMVLILIGLAFFRKEFRRLQKRASKLNHWQGKISSRHLFYFLLFLLAAFGNQNTYMLLMALAITVIIHKSFYREKGKEADLKLYLPLTIAFFTATLEIFARLQAFWAAGLLSNLDQFQTFGWTYLLTGLNEHIPLEASSISQNVSYLAVVSAGGLTLIAKSANIVAKKILKSHFPNKTISPFRHLAYSIPLTLLFALLVFLLGRFF